jgi:hypothetical protein
MSSKVGLLPFLSFSRLTRVLQSFSTFSKHASIICSLQTGKCCLISAITGSTCSSPVLTGPSQTLSVKPIVEIFKTSMLTLLAGNDRKSLDQVSRTIATARSSRSFHRLPTLRRTGTGSRRFGNFVKSSVVRMAERSRICSPIASITPHAWNSSLLDQVIATVVESSLPMHLEGLSSALLSGKFRQLDNSFQFPLDRAFLISKSMGRH